jgi:hypothetical protein
MPILIRIGIPSSSEDNRPRFIVFLSDVNQKDLYRRLQLAEAEYQAQEISWIALANKMRRCPSDPIPRLKLGASIDQFFTRLAAHYGFAVTNQIETLTRVLGIHKSALDYIRRASRKFQLKDVQGWKVVWMQLQEMTDIRDVARAQECLDLVLKGKIKSQKQIREFKRTANQ